MLDHVLLACSAASRQIVVGGGRIGIGEPLFCREQPAGSGPVAALNAGLRHVQQPVVLVLAADLPFVAGALGPLRAQLAAARRRGGRPGRAVRTGQLPGRGLADRGAVRRPGPARRADRPADAGDL